MAFQKYNGANNAIAFLDSPITNVSNTLTLKGSYDRFPTTNFIVTVVQYDINNDVEFRENMLISTRSGNICNIQTRKFELVPENELSQGSVQESYPFEVDSVVEVTNSNAFISDIQDEVTRLESDKLNKGALRTTLANTWRMFFTNGSNNETELPFGTSGTYLKSNGATSTPEWTNPPLDINGQTLDNSEPTASDYFAWYKSGVGNFKRVMKASTSVFGIVKFATDAQVQTGTDTATVVTPAQAKSLMKSVVITKNISDASTTTTYAHTLGKIPRYIVVDSSKGGGSFDGMSSNGVWYDTTNTCIFQNSNNSDSSSSGDSSIYFGIDNLNYQKGAIGNVTSSNFDVTWSKLGSISGTGAVIFKLFF